MFFSCNLSNVNLLKYISSSNQECKIRPEIANLNSDESTFYPYIVKTNECSGSFNNIKDPYAKIYLPDVVKNMNIKVFNLMSRTNETRYIKLHKACKCKCRLDASICNNKKRWNEDKCRCECKELLDKGSCDKGFNWNPSNCECECDKLCDVREYLDYENCKMLVHKLVEECTENIDEVKMAKISLAEQENMCKCFYALYIVLFSIIFTINIGTGTFFVCNKYMSHDK